MASWAPGAGGAGGHRSGFPGSLTSPLAGVCSLWGCQTRTPAFVAGLYPGNQSTKGTGLSSLVTDRKIQNKEQRNIETDRKIRMNLFSLKWTPSRFFTNELSFKQRHTGGFKSKACWYRNGVETTICFLRKEKKQQLLSVLLIFSKVFYKRSPIRESLASSRRRGIFPMSLQRCLCLWPKCKKVHNVEAMVGLVSNVP